MKILIANPPFKKTLGNRFFSFEKYYIRSGSRWPHSGVKPVGVKPHYLPFPFFLAYAAALLKKNGFDVIVSDGVALDKNAEEYLTEEVIPVNPDVVFFEAATPTIENDLLFAASVKKTTGAIVIVGGTHATTHFKDILISSPAAPDFVIRGEYEFALLELIKSLVARVSDGRCPENLAVDIRGVAYRDSENNLIDNGKSEPIETLDSLPTPLYEMFPSSAKPNPTIYWDGFCQYRPALQMHASRGCPYGCYFCLWPQVMYGSRRYRKFSPRRIVEEMSAAVKNYGAREIYFDDDDFTIDKKHVLEICRLIKERKLEESVKWSCMADAINIDEEMVSEMASAGCVGIKFGVESASVEVLEKIGKPVKLERIPAVLKMCARRGIKTHATFTIGLIGDTQQSIKETVRFVNTKMADVDSIQVSVATPYPGTEFYNWAVENRIIDPEKLSWSCFDGTAGSPMIRHPSFANIHQLEKLRAEFFKKWLIKNIIRPKWIFRQARIFLRSFFGQGPKFYLTKLWWGVVNHLGAMK